MKRRISHNDYITKLQNKNINVIPMENYITRKVKILHKCTCGNEWLITPAHVLKGTTCMKCRKNPNVFNLNTYLKILSSKKISLNEKFINVTTPIIHKCFCGNNWKVRPTSIINNQIKSCGCVRDNPYSRSYFKNKPTILYYLKIGELYKIGITTKTIKKRYQSEGIVYKIIKEKLFDDGSEAWDKELEIKREFKNKLYLGEKFMNKTNNTEVFIEDINPQF